jgi:hypothetical protein
MSAAMLSNVAFAEEYICNAGKPPKFCTRWCAMPGCRPAEAGLRQACLARVTRITASPRHLLRRWPPRSPSGALFSLAYLPFTFAAALHA